MPTAERVGFAVVGLGSISQAAVLPAFAHSKRARLAAVVSGDRKKAEKLGRKFGANEIYNYDGFDECLRGSQVEAVYIATPPASMKRTRCKRHGPENMCSVRSRWRLPLSRRETWLKAAGGARSSS